jgi:sulfonate transport system ATP-binding protein
MKITVKNISKHYKIENRTIKAVDDISADFEPFQISAIVGKSGCGKSTLLKLIAGIETLTSGAIECGGANIGISFQEPRLFPWLTVEKNLRFSSKNITDKQIDDMLKMLGLEDFKNAYPHQISGGMAQRVSLGRVLLFDSQIVLSDEPFSFLDYFSRKALQADFLAIQKRLNKTFIIVTHDLDEALSLGQEIYIMKEGKFKDKISANRTHDLEKKEKYKEHILRLI